MMSSLHHDHYTVITVVNENMTSVVAELNQLLEEAEQVSLERQRDIEAKADKEPVAMESGAAEAATVVRGHVIGDYC